MNQLKALGLFLIAAASLMAFAGSAYASNPVLTSTGAAVPVGTTYDKSATGSFFLEASVLQVTCTETTLHGQVLANTNGVLIFSIGTRTYNGCTPEATVDTLSTGSLEVKSGGEVISKGDRVTFSASGISCVYGGGTGTSVGTLENGGETTLEGKLPKQTGSNFLCPAAAEISGGLQLTTPHATTVD